MDPEIRRLLEEAEDYLAQGLQEETLSARAREQRDAILRAFQHLKARYRLEFPFRGESSWEGLGWEIFPDAEFPGK
ncbi:src kinase-associated phosphoprotein 1-like protein [Turdus rufiventris]|nr:src kinase-associated phosphoprotein 1-like protein [Turdus rufiventris]